MFFGGNEGHGGLTERDCAGSTAQRASQCLSVPWPPSLIWPKSDTVVSNSVCKSNPIRGPRTSIWTGSGRCGAAVDKPKSRCKKRKISSANRQTACNTGLCNFLYANINGFRSKSESINQIIEEQRIDVVMLNETKVYSKSAINIRGFQAFPVVRSIKSGGGLYIGVKHGLCESIMTDDSENADLVTIRLSRKEHGIRIIPIYGPQENDLEETVSSFYHDV